MIDGYKQIEVFVKDEDYEILLAAQKAFRAANENPGEATKAEARRLLREVEYFAPAMLCSAAEQHANGEAR